MITTAPPGHAAAGTSTVVARPSLGARIECHLRDRVEAAYRRARTTVYDVRPHDQPGPLAHSQQQALDDLSDAEHSLARFRTRGRPPELP